VDHVVGRRNGLGLGLGLLLDSEPFRPLRKVLVGLGGNTDFMAGVEAQMLLGVRESRGELVLAQVNPNRRAPVRMDFLNGPQKGAVFSAPALTGRNEV
jgi:hypothetical protein